ncbi:purine and uridine phosphorylase [Glonium stellatum]|uniref:Purine and uridine phosphorylase n=1 Tax=Glonium stellatum TaxID=574774 RepID=A0A8E2JN30_9PEZI|nr:purine and uridine phosphorylase [Glonium stellatum]
MAETFRLLSHADYTVGWICALPLELGTARAMLDEEHQALPRQPNDENTYILGRISAHNVVIACLPHGITGNNSAATVANDMARSFKSIRIRLMVGIGGGAPGEEADIRLGDVVVSKPTGIHGGVVQYDFGKTKQEGRFVRTGTLNKPPVELLGAIARLEAEHMSRDPKFLEYISAATTKHPKLSSTLAYPGKESDELFNATYDHKVSSATCDDCDRRELVSRPARHNTIPRIHYGNVASGNEVMRHGRTRDRWARGENVICFEMEAAGLMDRFPCLIIRGICDYADSHKNKRWQNYAAATAAAYAKELLYTILPGDTQVISSPTELSECCSSKLSSISTLNHGNYTIRTVYYNSQECLSRRNGYVILYPTRAGIPAAFPNFLMLRIILLVLACFP